MEKEENKNSTPSDQNQEIAKETEKNILKSVNKQKNGRQTHFPQNLTLKNHCGLFFF